MPEPWRQPAALGLKAGCALGPRQGGLRFAFDDVLMQGDALRINGSYYDTRAKNFIDGDVVMDFATFT